ncbi:Helix-turn-helix domain-containing protein, partial [Dysosmobacter welbionis]
TPAMAIRCFWPPESRWGAWRANSPMPTAARASSTRCRISLLETPRFSGAKATSSSTTLATIWLSGFWNTMPT